jgi:hypothetical protein
MPTDKIDDTDIYYMQREIKNLQYATERLEQQVADLRSDFEERIERLKSSIHKSFTGK